MSDPREPPDEKAARLGLVVRYPADNELFIDIDSLEALERHSALFDIFVQHHKGATSTAARSPSGRPGHWHIVVALSRPVKDQAERIILQALLGSDTKRELIAYLVDSRSCFFEKPEAPAAPPAPTPKPSTIDDECPF